MEKSDRIFIAGHNGLVGSSVHKILIEKGYKNLITVSSKKLDLRNYSKVEKYFKELSKIFTKTLNDCGIPFCKGNLMASNPLWRKVLNNKEI